MKKVNIINFVFILIIIFLTKNVHADDSIKQPVDPSKRVYTSKGDNNKCLRCHGQKKFQLTDAEGTIIHKKLYKELQIDTTAYYSGNHWDFKCTDCHSSDYDSFPHPLKAKFEAMPGCMDCHGADPQYAKFHFEAINEDFLKSQHSTKFASEFSCWSCHDAHYYKIFATGQSDIRKTVAYDNSICLSCHANINKFNLVADKQNPNIIKKHDWLPNQESHFKSVRCIECHAQRNDSTLVSHNIQPKEKAVKRCVECHSSNSLLMQSLYRYETEKKMNEQGFLNAMILKDTFVIGATSNIYLNIVSLIIFLLTLCAIGIHVYFRYKKLRNHGK